MNYRTVFHNLGNILMIESLFMLLPLLTAAVYREKTGFSFAVTAAFTFAAECCWHISTPIRTG